MHTEAHPLAGQKITIKGGELDGQEYRVEDWWDKLTGGSWMDADGNPAALDYAIRNATEGLRLDNEVVYGHLSNGLGKLVHDTQLPDDSSPREAKGE